MSKFLVSWLFLLGLKGAWAFEKLDSNYHISYGNPAAETQIIEYFSMSCAKCFEFFENDFSVIKSKYIERGEVFWVFHPDPADLLTLQLMACLEHLQKPQKVLFFEAVLKHLREKKYKHGAIIMQAAMEVLGHPLPDLGEMEFLEKTDAFKNAFFFLKQEDGITSIPTVEINQVRYESYPTREFLEKEILSLKKRKA